MKERHTRRPTYGDLARHLNISTAAVSYALNGKPGVSDVTRAEVLRVAAEWGYLPNSAAVALSARRSGAIGIVVSRDPEEITADGFYLHTLLGVERYLDEVDSQLLMRFTQTREEELDTYRRWAKQSRVDGFLLYDERSDDPRIPLVQELGVPFVVVSSAQRSDGVCRFVTPEAEVAQMVVDHLVAHGHHRIAHLGGPNDYLHEKVRRRMLATACRRRGAVLSVTECGDYLYESGEELARRVLTAPDSTRPTALIMGNDVMAAGAARAVVDLGLSSPEDVSIVSWEDSVLCRASRPGITAMDRRLTENARSAAELLFHVIAGGEDEFRIAARGDLVIRGSSDPAA